MKYGIWTLIGGLLIGAIIYVTEPLTPKGLDYFARCVSASGTVLYGTETHEHTPKQLEIFGDAQKYITFVECRDLETKEQIGICKEKSIPLYPMWELKDGSKFGGVKTLEQIAEMTGCEAPKVKALVETSSS